MPLSSSSALLEGLLLVAPQGATIATLSRAADLPAGEVEQALAALNAHYEAEKHGVRLLWSGRGAEAEIRLVAAADHAARLGRFLGTAESQKLSPAALETLAVIAYRQPVTRSDLESVRGVSCDAVLTTLIARDLVAEAGRAESIGHPLLYTTTTTFLERFGLTSLADLPALAQDAQMLHSLFSQDSAPSITPNPPVVMP